MTSNTGLLIVTRLSKIYASLSAVNKYVNSILYIKLHAPLLNRSSVIPAASYSKTISLIYSASAKYLPKHDVRIIITNLKKSEPFHKSIDVLLLDSDADSSSLIKETTFSNSQFNTANIIKLYNETNESIANNNTPNEDQQQIENDTADMYDDVVLGGTFDRLHVGHKILLTEAVLRAKYRLVVGVTDSQMIKGKKLYELILPVEQRIAEVLDFLHTIDTTLKYEVVPIQDPFGPTKSDPNLQLIIVSAETLRGGEKVNEIRIENNLLPLKIYCIELVESVAEKSDNSIKETKISSSNQRMDLLGSRIREPEPKPHLPIRPYLIGMIGGIASGKSIMTQRFEKFGAKIIDCDKLAHQLYEPGERCYNDIITVFGKDIINDTTDRKINRKKLGDIVFGDHKQLEHLNQIVWPALLIAVKKRIQELYSKDNCQICIIEAAILLKAGWLNEFHEIWSIIVPQTDVIFFIIIII